MKKTLLIFYLFAAKLSVGQGIPNDFICYFEEAYRNLKWLPEETRIVDIDSVGYEDNICHHKKDTFSYTVKKTSELQVTLNQPYGSTESIPFLLDTYAYPSTQKACVDFSPNGVSVSFQFTNTSNYYLRLIIALVDTSGNEIDAYGTSPDYTVYKDQIYFNVDPERAISKTFNYLTKNSYKAKFSSRPSSGACPEIYADGKDTSFNMKTVAGILFTIVNMYNADDLDSYKPYPLDSATFTISSIVLRPAVVTDLENKLVSKEITFSPNPTKNTLNFSQALSSIKLFDLIGNVVYGTSSAESMDISHLTPGMYLLTASELHQPLKIVKE